MAEDQVTKVILFDIGGVCVLSPFQAILDYEKSLSIPPGYINFSISRSAPDGYWHRLERGEIPLDAAFFIGFKEDLSRPDLWKAFHQKVAATRTTSNEDSLEDVWSATGPLPVIDAEHLFWQMMGHSRTPDPYFYPALKKLKASNKFVVAALSNTVIFPDGHPYNERQKDDVRDMFDLFVSSAHVGMRKPDAKIYEYTLAELEKIVKNSGGELKAENVVFLDDIGQNLKSARTAGMRTIRVVLGKTWDAVRQLEQVTGMDLLETQPTEGEQERSKARL